MNYINGISVDFSMKNVLSFAIIYVIQYIFSLSDKINV